MDHIEAQAEQILSQVPEWLWDGETLPVPLEHIADSVFGLLVRDVEDLASAPGCPPLPDGHSLSGLLLADRGEIWVNAWEGSEWPGRRRFTIGHELGHWCLHRADGGIVYCRHASVGFEKNEAQAEPGASEVPLTEQEANAFGAALLMPARLMQREYERDSGFYSLCDRFGVSGAAMGKRLQAVLAAPADRQGSRSIPS